MRSLLEPQPRFGGAFSWGSSRQADSNLSPRPPTYARRCPPAFIPPRLALPRRPKHDGYPMMARGPDGHDWTERYPLVVEAVNQLKVRSRMIDGEVVCCDERGLATFQLLRHRRNEPHASSRP